MQRSLMLRAAATMALASFGLMGTASPAHAQDSYPSKTIKFIVPYPPGASTDSMARAFAQELAKEAKATVIVENRPGAGTSIGALAVKALPADGHAMLFQTGELFATKLSTPGVAYELQNFEIVAPLAQTPFVLIVPAQYDIKTLEDLRAHAAKHNAELKFGSLGLGANQYNLLSRTLAQHLGAKPRMIPYKGGMEGVMATMSGEIDAYFATVGLAYSQKDNPKVRAIALTSDGGANKFFPNVKSFKELGVKDMVYSSLYGVAVRTETPEPLKAQLRQLARRVTDSAELKKVRSQISLEDFAGTLDDYQGETQRNFQMLKQAVEQSRSAEARP